MRTLVGALAVLLAICVALYAWQKRDAGVAPLRASAPEHSPKPSNSNIEPTLADAQGSAPVPTSPERGVAHQATGESVLEKAGEQTLAPPPPNVYPVITSELPSYLDYWATQLHPTPPNGCASPFQLLFEMREGTRDESWASRVERELQDLLGPHPLGFHVSITCRAAICQISAHGPIKRIAEKETEYNMYWWEFREKLRHAPSASEFASAQFFGAADVEDATQDVAGFALTTFEHPAATKSPHCANFKPGSAKD